MRCPHASDNRIVNKLARQKSLLLWGQLVGEVTGNIVIEEDGLGWWRRDGVRGQHVGEAVALRRVVGSGWSRRAEEKKPTPKHVDRGPLNWCVLFEYGELGFF
jgi:hypothetical protein